MKDLTHDDNGTIITVPASAIREHLEAEGWIPVSEADECCGHDITGTYEAGIDAGRREVDTTAIIERWHNDNHDGVLRFCYLEPCRPFREAVGL